MDSDINWCSFYHCIGGLKFVDMQPAETGPSLHSFKGDMVATDLTLDPSEDGEDDENEMIDLPKDAASTILARVEHIASDRYNSTKLFVELVADAQRSRFVRSGLRSLLSDHQMR